MASVLTINGCIFMKKLKLVFTIFLTSLTIQAIAADFSHLDPDKIIPKDLLKKALDYYNSNEKTIKKKNVIGIIDFSQHNSKKRFYIINMENGEVDRYLVAHGIGSDKKFTGYTKSFSNVEGSGASSQGFYLTAETYYGKHGYSLKLDGLSTTNSNARERLIVIHSADYVEPTRDVMGRSNGCPAVDERYRNEIINTLKDGALLYADLAVK
jgi:hypothetical protein